MKLMDLKDMDRLPGRRIQADETFSFRCHPDISCFNRCCRNLNLMLYPYDVLRLKKRLGISSDRFINDYIHVVLRPSSYFPDVLLKMAENDDKPCPFLTPSGCSVYSDRPDACRTFPLEQGVYFHERTDDPCFFYFLRPPEFCRGPNEEVFWTPEAWIRDQEAEIYRKMMVEWAKIKRLFSSDPWEGRGMDHPKAKMAFMAAYNVDLFREFVFNSTFLKRYRVDQNTLKKIRAGSDTELMRFGFEWITFYTWGIRSTRIRLKQKFR
ncbi:MAG: YkgJ family cysteine cluster protein [Desulfobacterales bacterium]